MIGFSPANRDAQGVVGQRALDVFAPFNDENPVIHVVEKAGGVQILPALHAVHIEMIDHMLAAVFIHQRKGRAGNAVAGDLLLDYSNYSVESVFEKIKHGHVKIIYSYLTRKNMVIVASSGAAIVTSNGERLIAYAYPE